MRGDSVISRTLITLEDRLRYSRVVRHWLCEWKRRRGGGAPCHDVQALARSIDRLCAAARLATEREQLLAIEAEILQRVEKLGGRQIDWREFEAKADRQRIEMGVVLKPWISEREKGVVFIAFEDHWARLLQCCDVTEFAKRYTLVVAPVWASPHGLVDFVLPAQWPERVFCTISDPDDAAILPRISNKYIVAPLLCSNWVNPALFQPVSFPKKDIDIVMLANFAKYKRHHALFAALGDLPRSLKVVLMGTHNGARTAESLTEEARAFGVADRIELIESPSDAVVFDRLARAKISLILSMREGSCVAVVESMFANTPVGIFEDAQVGSRVFINEATGRYLKHDGLAEQLKMFVADAEQLAPREWALANGISCEQSSVKLNEIVKREMLANGQEWTRDLATMHWRPNPQILHAADWARMKAEYVEIKKRFGVELGTEW